MKKVTGALLLFSILVLLLFVVSCTKKECATPTDCVEQQGKTVSCSEEGACVYRERTCSKTVRMTLDGKSLTAKYLTQELNQSKQCVVVAQDVHQERIVDEKQLPFFKLSTIISFPQPFVKQHDDFVFEFQLKDVHKDLEPPIMLTQLRILDKENLIADQDLRVRLTNIGDKAQVQVPVSYDIDAEEERPLSFKIDYEHDTRTHDDTLTIRKDYAGSFKRKVVLVDPDKAEP